MTYIEEQAPIIDLYIKQGTTFFPFPQQITDDDGNPEDLTGASAIGQVRNGPADSNADVLLEFSTDNGNIEELGPDGLVKIHIISGDQINNLDFDVAEYDLLLTRTDGTTECIQEGKVYLNRRITEISG